MDKGVGNVIKHIIPAVPDVYRRTVGIFILKFTITAFVEYGNLFYNINEYVF